MSGSCEAGSISVIVVLRKGLSQAIEKLDQLLKASETLSGILAGKQLGSILERGQELRLTETLVSVLVSEKRSVNQRLITRA